MRGLQNLYNTDKSADGHHMFIALLDTNLLKQ